MDMELLSKMVGELILERDSVGLPGVGTFVAEIVPATFSDKGYTINPPYRRLSFTSEVLEDECLAEFYAGENSLDVVSAKAYLSAFLSEMKAILKERRAVTFPGLGRLRSTRQDTIFFVPAEELDIFPDGFGLESVSLKTHVETDEDVSIAVSDLASIIENARSAARTAPEPAPAARPETAAPVEPASVPAAAAQQPSEATPAPVPEPAAQPEPGAEPQPEPAAQPVPEASTSEPESTRKSRWWIWPLVIILLVAVFFATFFILARVAPDILDKILYTEEELRIINS